MSRINLPQVTATLWLGLALLAPAQQPAKPVPSGTTGEGTTILIFTDERPILLTLDVSLDGQPLARHWRDRVEKLFRFLDRNGDGRLDQEECRRVVLTNTAGFPTDYDADGFVSLEEFCRWLCAVNYGPLRAGVYLLSSSPYTSYFAWQSGRPTADPLLLARALFDRLDRNGDGKLDSEEIAAAERTLRQLDQDEDETVTPDEVFSGWLPPESRASAQRTADISRPDPRLPSRLLILGTEAAPDLAVRLVQMFYGREEQAIARRQLRAEDLHYPPQLFAQLDNNGDGVLDAEELRGLVRRPADVEITLRLATSQAANNRPHAHFENARTRYDLRAHLSPEKVVIGTERSRLRISARLWTSPAARKSDEAAAKEMLRKLFRLADRDQNGYLDQREFAQLVPGRLAFSFSFAELDRDSDGKIVEQEFLAGLEPILTMQMLTQELGLSLLLTHQGPHLFAQLDSNGDGKLGIRDWRRAPHILRSLDRNGDGVLEWTELTSHYLLDIAPGGQGVPGALSQLLRVPPVFVPAPLLREPEPRKPANAPAWFRAMDRNGDGDISRREFVGSDEEFRRLDLDGDGLISLEEALRATPSGPTTPAPPAKP